MGRKRKRATLPRPVRTVTITVGSNDDGYIGSRDDLTWMPPVPFQIAHLRQLLKALKRRGLYDDCSLRELEDLSRRGAERLTVEAERMLQLLRTWDEREAA